VRHLLIAKVGSRSNPFARSKFLQGDPSDKDGPSGPFFLLRGLGFFAAPSRIYALGGKSADVTFRAGSAAAIRDPALEARRVSSNLAPRN
jgi:hypothetical protein